MQKTQERSFFLSSHLVKVSFCVLVLCWLSACQTELDPEPQRTRLSVEVLDIEGKPRPDATVQLYASLMDLQRRFQPLRTQKSDAQGLAHFQDLAASSYFVYASYESQDAYFDNEATGDVAMDKPLSLSQAQTFFTITAYKRPVQPQKVSIQSCWLQDYPELKKLQISADSSLWLSEPIYVDFYVGEKWINRVGPMQFYQSSTQDGKYHTLSLPQKSPQPNPTMALNQLAQSPLELDFQGSTQSNSQYHLEIDLRPYFKDSDTSFPDRILIDQDQLKIGLELLWE